jgi:drug/metabolite transporter (DMT)-like permease
MSGALFMAISMAGFAMNDTLVKLASASINIGQVMLVRGAMATALILLLSLHQGALRHAASALRPMVLTRVACETLATVSFLLALSHLPIGNVSAILQALPVCVTLGAALVFGEPVGWRRWLSIAAGFLGVVIIVRPGLEGFSVHSVWALVSVFFCTLRDLATRKIDAATPSLVVSAATAVSVTIVGALLVQPFGGWTPMPSAILVTLAGAACLVIVGYQFVIVAMRTGDISFMAPFRYTALLWAIALGFLVFSDVPDTATIVGSVIVVGSGIYMIYRERVRGRSRPAADSVSPSMAPDGV